MGLFGNEFRNVVEWQESDDTVIFHKWHNDEIKKGSRLIIRPGQDAIFLYNGKIEGIFQDEGSFDIESQIIPFLSTLKGFSFGFNSGIRAEVLFVNTKEFTVKWGTKNAVMLPCAGLPGGLPVRAFGTFQMKVSDYVRLIDTIAGVKDTYSVDDVKTRVLSILDQLLMKWIVREGKDMFHLQAYADEIGRGIAQDLDMEMMKIGIGITAFNISSLSYPEEIQKMATKAASQSMVGDMGRYQQMAMMDAMSKGGGGGTASDMAGMAMGMAMGQQMASQMGRMYGQNTAQQQAAPSQGAVPEGGCKFCPDCGTKTEGMKFCPNCGRKLM